MKVKVSFTVDIDPEVWDANYGTGTAAAAVRKDVQEYAYHTLTEHIREATGALIDSVSRGLV